MPAAAPFFPHGGILRAAYRALRKVARDTDIAADTLTDIFQPALLNFIRQKGIGNRRAGRTNHIEYTPLDLSHHDIGRGKAAHPHHRLGGQLFHERYVGLLRTLFTKSSRDRIIGPVTDIHIPKIRQLGQHLNYLTPFGIAADAIAPQQFIYRKSKCHTADITHRIPGIFQQFAGQPHAVFQ